MITSDSLILNRQCLAHQGEDGDGEHEHHDGLHGCPWSCPLHAGD